MSEQVEKMMLYHSQNGIIDTSEKQLDFIEEQHHKSMSTGWAMKRKIAIIVRLTVSAGIAFKRV